jgi:hypothetical protein
MGILHTGFGNDEALSFIRWYCTYLHFVWLAGFPVKKFDDFASLGHVPNIDCPAEAYPWYQ